MEDPEERWFQDRSPSVSSNADASRSSANGVMRGYRSHGGISPVLVLISYLTGRIEGPFDKRARSKIYISSPHQLILTCRKQSSFSPNGNEMSLNDTIQLSPPIDRSTLDPSSSTADPHSVRPGRRVRAKACPVCLPG